MSPHVMPKTFDLSGITHVNTVINSIIKLLTFFNHRTCLIF